MFIYGLWPEIKLYYYYDIIIIIMAEKLMRTFDQQMSINKVLDGKQYNRAVQTDI